jgi:hypothetical protein
MLISSQVSSPLLKHPYIVRSTLYLEEIKNSARGCLAWTFRFHLAREKRDLTSPTPRHFQSATAEKFET